MQFAQLKRRDFITPLGGTAVWPARPALQRDRAELRSMRRLHFPTSLSGQCKENTKEY